MNNYEALCICRDKNQRVRSENMPAGDWVAFDRGQTTVQTTLPLLPEYIKEVMLANGVAIKLAPCYLYYSASQQTLYRTDDPGYSFSVWEVV